MPFSTHTQIINIMAFVRLALWNLDSFVTMDKVTSNVEIKVCLYINISLPKAYSVIA